VNELNGSQLLQQAQTTVVSNSDIYGLLDKNISTYTPVDITEGLDGTKLTQYFSPLRARSNFTTPGTPTPEPEEIPEVWPTAVTFIYKGQNVNYAILDGVLIREGGLTPDGLTLSTIENNRVLIKGKRSERWITLEF
jgi:hypothetical protein